MLLGLGVGLYVYEFTLLRKARKENCQTTELIFRKLRICSYGKWAIIGFVVIKIGLLIFCLM